MTSTAAKLRAHYWCNAETAAPVEHAGGGGTFVAFSQPAPGEPGRTNEDSAAALVFGGASALLTVADGAGGMPRGDRASHDAVRALIRAARQAERSDVARREGILTGIDRANAAVRKLGGAATTLVAAHVTGGTVRTFHVGDSGALVVSAAGRIKLRTIDHSPAGYAVEAGTIDEDEALHHDDRHLLLNSLGTRTMRIEVSSRIRLGRRDTLLLASDGLFDNLLLDEIADAIRRGPLPTAIERLASRARERMLDATDGEPSKIDDLAVLAFRLT